MGFFDRWRDDLLRPQIIVVKLPVQNAGRKIARKLPVRMMKVVKVKVKRVRGY